MFASLLTGVLLLRLLLAWLQAQNAEGSDDEDYGEDDFEPVAEEEEAASSSDEELEQEAPGAGLDPSVPGGFAMPGWRDPDSRHLRLPNKGYVPAKEHEAFYGPPTAEWRDPETRHVRTVGSEVVYNSAGPKTGNIVDRWFYSLLVVLIAILVYRGA